MKLVVVKYKTYLIYNPLGKKTFSNANNVIVYYYYITAFIVL